MRTVATDHRNRSIDRFITLERPTTSRGVRQLGVPTYTYRRRAGGKKNGGPSSRKRREKRCEMRIESAINLQYEHESFVFFIFSPFAALPKYDL